MSVIANHPELIVQVGYKGEGLCVVYQAHAPLHYHSPEEPGTVQEYIHARTITGPV